jgi:hypothetical protein
MDNISVASFVQIAQKIAWFASMNLFLSNVNCLIFWKLTELALINATPLNIMKIKFVKVVFQTV